MEDITQKVQELIGLVVAEGNNRLGQGGLQIRIKTDVKGNCIILPPNAQMFQAAANLLFPLFQGCDAGGKTYRPSETDILQFTTTFLGTREAFLARYVGEDLSQQQIRESYEKILEIVRQRFPNVLS
jgi:hypothetical protein